jgi:hypothetical protein
MLLEAIKFVAEQDKASKNTLFLFHFLFQSNLENSVIKSRIMSHKGGGSEKHQKSVTSYLNGPSQENLR